MKKLIFVVLAVCSCLAAVQAYDTFVPVETVSLMQDDKVKIKSDELPESIKRSLEAQDFKGWLINAAFKSTKEESYTVELKNGAETKTVKFDKEGNKIG